MSRRARRTPETLGPGLNPRIRFLPGRTKQHQPFAPGATSTTPSKDGKGDGSAFGPLGAFSLYVLMEDSNFLSGLKACRDNCLAVTVCDRPSFGGHLDA